ncbi:DMT family transporter [Rhodohalobacter halophilus]|uniref:DMT family transporter n=1 Tax=Rhodohalobacter halophilus TaxID=1812810 RepID=UPI00083F9E00|nr:DMT family transporter [Rhodohalobacter halophilus]
MNKNLLTDLSLLFLAIIWGTNFTVIKASLAEIDPYSFNSIRFVLAAGFMWAILIKRKSWFKIDRKDILPLLLLGLIGNMVYQWLFIVGIDLTFAANAAVMLGTIPIWVALSSHLFSIEMMNRFKTIGVILAFTGLAIIILFGKNPISFGSDTFLGDLTIILAAIIWALYTLYSKKHLTRYTPLQYSAMMTSIGAVSLTLLAIPHFGETNWSTVSVGAYSGAIFSGMLAIGLAYLIWNNGIKVVGAVRSSTYQNLVPVIGVISGVVLLNENLEFLQYLGAAIVIAGILITRHGGRIS